MFDFDLSIIDESDFKEDSVREEIISPILKRLGYKATGEYRIQRSKKLIHPYVIIGSKKHNVNIIPDYTLYIGDCPVLVLEAKAPSEEITNSIHVEQTYSYAIHPDINIKHYSLCNGKRLVCFSINQWNPILDIDISDIETKWSSVETVLGPKYLLNPELREFKPDFGITCLKAGLNKDAELIFLQKHLQYLEMYELGKYTGSTATMLGDLDCFISLDMEAMHVNALLSNLPKEISDIYKNQLGRAPFCAEMQGKVILSCRGKLGEIIKGKSEDFVPVNVEEIISVEYDESVILDDYNPLN